MFDHRKRLRVLSGLLGILLPVVAWAQTPWMRTIELKDRRDDNQQPVVATVTFLAYTMTEPTSPGQPVMMGAGNVPEPLRFSGLETGYLKFKISKIDWSPLGSTFDGSADYKVIVRNQWVDMTPQIYLDGKKGTSAAAAANLRKRYITAQNFEYVKGDSLPPPTIFKIDKNRDYAFTIGVKAVTPKTVEEKPFDFIFNFKVEGLTDPTDLPPEPPTPTGPTDDEIRAKRLKDSLEAEAAKIDVDGINEAVKIAIDNEDAPKLIEVIKDYPTVESVKKAREYLALKMTKELMSDGMTYRIDISYDKFTKAAPTKDLLVMGFQEQGRPITEAEINAQWRDGQLFLRPPRDSIDYMVSAVHRITPEHKTSKKLNRATDNIKFVYRDTLEGARVIVRVNGGSPPYTLYAERVTDGGGFVAEEGKMVISGDTVLDKEKMARAFKLSQEGDFRLLVEESGGGKKTGLDKIHIVPPPPIPPIVWYIGAGALAAFLIGFLLYRREQRRKDEELERLLEARGGADPRVKRKPKPELQLFWKETAISELSLHKNFIREIATYLKERPHFKSDKPMIEGVLLGTVLKFDFENEQYEVRLDRFRAIEPRTLDHYEDAGSQDQWQEIREVAEHHRDLVKIGWLQVAEGRDMRLSTLEQQFQDEQFSELFQLMLKIDFVDGKKLCGFFTRTTSGKINNVGDRQEGVTEWLNWDELEDAGYYENTTRAVRDESGAGKIKVRIKGQETA